MPNSVLKDLGTALKAKNDALKASTDAAVQAQKDQTAGDLKTNHDAFSLELATQQTENVEFFDKEKSNAVKAKDDALGEIENVLGISGSAPGSGSVWELIAFANNKDLAMETYQNNENAQSIANIAATSAHYGIGDNISF